MDYNELIEHVAKSIVTETKKIIGKAPYDKTFKAKIIRQISATKYCILYKGREYTAKAKDFFYKPVGSIVWVCAPENNWKELYIEEPVQNFQYLAPCNSLDDFVSKTAHGSLCGMEKLCDRVGWLPQGVGWYRVRYSYQNWHNNGKYSVCGLLEVYASDFNIYYGFVSGKTSPYSVTWYKNNITAI